MPTFYNKTLKLIGHYIPLILPRYSLHFILFPNFIFQPVGISTTYFWPVWQLSQSQSCRLFQGFPVWW